MLNLDFLLFCLPFIHSKTQYFFSSKILMLKVTIFVLEIIQPLKDYCNYTEIKFKGDQNLSFTSFCLKEKI